jgi:hypothetical protein
MIKTFLTVFLLLISSSTFSSQKEIISMKDIFVGDSFYYSIEFDPVLPVSISYPTGDFFEEGQDLPLFRVLHVTKNEKKLTLQLRFYSPGEFILPVSWNESTGIKNSEYKIKIQSRLTGMENDIEDNDPPLIFSGTYLLRLIFASFLFMFMLYLLYAMFVFWKKHTKIVNAEWEDIPEIDPRTKKRLLVEERLKNQTIPQKDFCFLFSSYCKEEYSFRLKSNLLHLTDSNFLAYLYDHSGLQEADLREIRNVFRNVKYSDHSKILSQEEATSLWLEWKSKLKI